MEKRQLGKTDMHITPVGFGAWAIGGEGWFGAWGPQEDETSIAAIHRAVDQGINWIDTAMVYGMGHSETIIGQAIKGMAEPPLIFTKCSRWLDENGDRADDQRPEALRRNLEDSLRRLDVETIDLYQVHWPMPEDEIEMGWETLAAMKAEGKVRAIGVSNYSVAQMERIREIAPVDTLQPPYSVLRREAEADVLPYCAAHDIGVIVYSPMQSGLLTGKMSTERAANMPENDWRTRHPFFKEPMLSRNLRVADLLIEIGARHGKSAAETAIAWTLHNPAVTAAIVGARRPDQVDGIVGAADFRLSDEELAEIDAFLQANPAPAQ